MYMRENKLRPFSAPPSFWNAKLFVSSPPPACSSLSESMSYYHGLISSRRANSLLSQRPDGSFLLRDSQSQPGNFVLSAKFLGRMYHVLIFQQGGKYILDSASPGGSSNETDGGGIGGEVEFNSLDELVLFLTGHNLKVGDDEVHLTDTCPCADDAVRLSSNTLRRTKEMDDTDIMTDTLANLFGTRTVVICVAHSALQLDGQPLAGDNIYWAVLVKDLDQKGYFIKIVDKEEKVTVREKKVGKQFQYDIPGDLVMTFLSEHGITCVGFRDTQEKDRFLHQVDRLVRLQQDRSVKLRERAESEVKKKTSQLQHRIKASEFDVENLSPEWSYLFDQAGVTKKMLQDQDTLQFILDTVCELGDPQELLPTVYTSAATKVDEKPVLERERAIALDANLKRESIRASKLAEVLQKESIKSPSPVVRENVCSYLAACERFKDHLVIKYSMIALGPENAFCFCQQCGADRPRMQVTGNPPQQFQLPLGWVQFVHRSRTHSLAMEFSKHWHTAFCCVPSSKVHSIMRTGQLPLTDSVQLLSPDIQVACAIADVPQKKYQDNVTGSHYKVWTVFQVYIQPGTYSVHMGDRAEGGQIQWHATARTYVVHSLWVSMETPTAAK